MAFGFTVATANDSPWTKEYGTSTEDFAVRPGQSWLDPSFPTMDPRTFNVNAPGLHAMDIQQPTALARPAAPDLDALFWSELIQMARHSGLRSWEAAALANPAWSYGPMGQPTLKVKQSGWLCCLKKFRWCSLERPILETSPGLAAAGFGQNDIWSVDDPRVWGELSVAIEVADRILRRALTRDWLRSFLSPDSWIVQQRDIRDPKRGPAVQLNVNTDSFVPAPNIPIKTEQEALAWLEDLFKGQKPLWQLYADTDDRVRIWDGLTQSSRWMGPHGPHVQDVVAFIDVGPLRTLLNPNSTSHARYMARGSLAIVICHEFMHVLRHQMVKQRGEVLSDIEPFYNGELVAEVGHSFINDFFGCAPEKNPMANLRPLRGPNATSGPYLLVSACHFPESHMGDPRFLGTFHVGQPQPPVIRGYIKYPLPVFWWRALSDADFWDNQVRAHQQQTIFCPLVLRSSVAIVDGLALYADHARWDPAVCNAITQNFRLKLQHLSGDLSTIRGAMRRWRPWHAQAQAQWAATLYSYFPGRDMLRGMRDAFSAPLTLHKEQLAAKFVARFITPQVRQQVAGWQPAQLPGTNGAFTIQQALDHLDYAKAWFYRAMSFLVVTALPPRNQDLGFSDPPLVLGPPKTWRRSGNRAFPVGWDPQAFGNPHRPTTYNLRARHQPNAMHATEVQARESNISLARRCILTHVWCTLTTISLRAAFSTQINALMQDMQALRQQLAANPNAPQHNFPFTFQVPPYTEAVRFRGAQHPSLTLTMMRNMNPLRQFQQILQPNTNLRHRWTKMPQNDFFLARVTEFTQVTYFTLGELYDLRVREDDVLVLAWCNSEIEIYKLADVMEALSMTAEEVSAEMDVSPYGYILTKNFGCQFHSEHTGVFSLGRVAQWLREEDVALRDGKEDQPHWISAGGFVFDITDLDTIAEESQADLVKALKGTPGGNPMPGVDFEGHDIQEALDLIKPLRIGMTVPFGLSIASGANRIFEKHELGWYEFHETSQYVQIYDDIYDITDYAKWHPGGMEIMTNTAGTNCTSLFEKHHSENGKALLEDIKGLRIGRMVPSQRRSQNLSAMQICINDNIFDIGPLRTENEKLFVSLGEYGGRDVSEEMPTEKSAKDTEQHPLVLLFNSNNDLIVAKIQKDADQLPAMNKSQLKMHDGEDIDDHGFAASYLAYNGAVFDVTTLMRHGPDSVTNNLLGFLGDTIDERGPNKKVGQFLQKNYSFRIIARLVADDDAIGQQAALAGHWDAYRSRPLTHENFNKVLAIRAKEMEAYDSSEEAMPSTDSEGMDQAEPVPKSLDISPKAVMAENETRNPGEHWETPSEKSSQLQMVGRLALTKLQEQLEKIGSKHTSKTKKGDEKAGWQCPRGRKRYLETEARVGHIPAKRIRVV